MVSIPFPWKTEKTDPIGCDQMSRKSPAKSKMPHMVSTIPIRTQYKSLLHAVWARRSSTMITHNKQSGSGCTSFSDKNCLKELEFSTLSFSKLNIFLAIDNFVDNVAS